MMIFDNVMHGFHLVDLSPWPFMNSLNIFSFFSSIIVMMDLKIYYGFMLSIALLLINLFFWWQDVHRESSYQGCHSSFVMNLVLSGMILFIVSEVFFFFSFFWESLHYILVSDNEFSFYWPPKGIKFFKATGIPLLNTIILLSSGITATYSHFLFMKNYYSYSIIYLMITIVLGLYFTFLQGFEYLEASFTISDSVFGSTFFLSTGFHGLHVIVGSLFLMVSMSRMMKFFTTMKHNLNFEMSLWYWHFVDVVWLFLYMIIYIWSN